MKNSDNKPVSTDPQDTFQEHVRNSEINEQSSNVNLEK